MKRLYRFMGLIQLMRPQSVLLMLLFIYVPIVVHTSDYVYALMQVMPLYFLLTMEIVLNDYMDIDKDKINKPHRPLAMGKVNPHQALKVIVVSGIVAFAGGLYVYRNEPQRLGLFLLVFIILTLYSICSELLAPFKAFITAITTFLCLCYIFTYMQFTRVLLCYAFAAFFYISSREILMDIRDYEGDRQFKCRTLAVRFGKQKAYWLAVFLMGISQFLFVCEVVTHTAGINKLLWIIAMGILVILFARFKDSTPQIQNKIVLLLWIPMLMTIPCLIMQ